MRLQVLSLTPCFSGVLGPSSDLNRFSGFSRSGETVQAVHAIRQPEIPGHAQTPLITLVLATLLVALISGCVTDQKKPRATPAKVNAPFDQIELLCAPVALDFDKIPGPDGISVRVYAMSSRSPKAMPIVRGTLELLMYDGLLKAGGAESQKPLRTWSYTAEELKDYAYNTVIGTSYGLTPLWGETKPAQNRITVIARYTSPEGAQISSAPSVISVPAH